MYLIPHTGQHHTDLLVFRGGRDITEMVFMGCGRGIGVGVAHTKKKYGISSLPGLGKDFMTKAQRLSNFDSTNSSVNRYFVK